jgi:predicted 2-oxoglutarate/Fe(II)-dependent dioxygenase YbiX
MSDICDELSDLLRTVRRPGDFHASGRLEFLAPRLVVEGVGQIALPLLPVQAEQLIAVAKRAPYGRGAATIVDTSVRRTWQIGPNQVRLGGKHWPETLNRIIALAAEGLGVSEPVSAELYKLLIYDEGSFFVSHRDTEKQPGMFATLVLALPSQSSGGELVVRHKGREAKLDLASDEPSEMAFAAFYADCVHEVLPVTAGCRATLIYNLARKGKDAMLEPPDYEAEVARAMALLQQWAKGTTSAQDGAPEKVVYPLEHAYSPAELDFAKLKGADAAAAALLASAVPQADCDLHLALVSIGESGSAEHHGSYRRRYRGDDDDDSDEFEVVEVHDRWESLTQWRRPDGVPAALGNIPIEGGEVSPPDALADMEPYEEHFQEATGNEGASFERTYRRAALVLWPRRRRLAVINQAGPGATLPFLESLAAKWIDEGAKPDSALWIEAHELSGHMLDAWPTEHWYGGGDDEEGDEEDESDADVEGDEDGEADNDDAGDEADDAMAEDARSELARVLAALTGLRDETRIATAVELLTAGRGHDKTDNDAILEAVALFPPERAARMIEAIVASHANEALASCCALLDAAVAGSFAANPKHLATAAGGLVAALPGDPALAPADDWGRRHHVVPGAGVVGDLVRIAEAVDAALAKRLAAHLLAWPETYGFDHALVPAVKRLFGGGARQSGVAMKSLHAACLAHLEARAAEPLEAPKDWSRASKIQCSCEHCAALSRFLASPVNETWTLKAAEPVRRHVEEEVKAARADLDTRTERRGSPHSLICRKNCASYDRRTTQRRQDLADIATLKGTTRRGGASKS